MTEFDIDKLQDSIETESQFMDLLQFIEDAQLDRVGCFKYSNVDFNFIS